MAGVPAAVMALLAVAAVAGPQYVGRGGGSLSTFERAARTTRPAIPDIDRRMPARTETATFALG